MDRFVVGIDCGTQSAKVVIFDQQGIEVARGEQPLRPMARPQPGVVLHPDDDVWVAIASASRLAMAQYQGSPEQIVGIGVCPIRCCKAFLDDDLQLIEPVISWMDDRAYRPYRPTDRRLRWTTSLSGYVTARLTGATVDTAANNIDLQWPVDMRTWQWRDQVDDFGLHRDELFQLQMPGEIAGALTDAASTATGLPAGTPVVHSANDKAVELLGVGPLDTDTVLVSLGTYIAAMRHGAGYLDSTDHVWTNFAAIPGSYVYESAGIRRGMWMITWLLDTLGPEFAAAANAAGQRREDYLEPEAAAVPAGCDGLLTVLDWLAPASHPYRKGSMLGFDARHGRGHMYRSILEAIALTMFGNVAAMDSQIGANTSRIVLSGGGASSVLFSQIFADVFELPTERSVDGGAARGAAMCAAAGVGLYPDVAAACQAMAPPRRHVEPHPTAAYRAMRGEPYSTVRALTDPLYQHMFSPPRLNQKDSP